MGGGKRTAMSPAYGLDRRAFLRLVGALCIGVGGACGPRGWASGGSEVHLLLSEAGSAYREVADAFVAAYDGRATVRTQTIDRMAETEIDAANRAGNLLVPIGVRAARRVAETYAGRAAVLVLLAPRAAIEALPWARPPGQRTSAVYLDQPFRRPLSLIRMIWPRADRVGVLLAESEAGSDTGQALHTEASRQGISLQVEPVADERDLPQALRRLLAQVQVLLLTPDPAVVNELSARLILVSSYRQNIPVVAFSRGLVNAGAVVSVVSDPHDIGREGGLLARHWNPLSGALPAARHATRFDLALNHRVASSLGVDPRNLELWLQRLRDGE